MKNKSLLCMLFVLFASEAYSMDLNHAQQISHSEKKSDKVISYAFREVNKQPSFLQKASPVTKYFGLTLVTDTNLDNVDLSGTSTDPVIVSGKTNFSLSNSTANSKFFEVKTEVCAYSTGTQDPQCATQIDTYNVGGYGNLSVHMAPTVTLFLDPGSYTTDIAMTISGNLSHATAYKHHASGKLNISAGAIK